jgi:hypothetical protein
MPPPRAPAHPEDCPFTEELTWRPRGRRLPWLVAFLLDDRCGPLVWFLGLRDIPALMQTSRAIAGLEGVTICEDEPWVYQMQDRLSHYLRYCPALLADRLMCKRLAVPPRLWSVEHLLHKRTLKWLDADLHENVLMAALLDYGPLLEVLLERRGFRWEGLMHAIEVVVAAGAIDGADGGAWGAVGAVNDVDWCRIYKWKLGLVYKEFSVRMADSMQNLGLAIGAPDTPPSDIAINVLQFTCMGVGAFGSLRVFRDVSNRIGARHCTVMESVPDTMLSNLPWLSSEARLLIKLLHRYYGLEASPENGMLIANRFAVRADQLDGIVRIDTALLSDLLDEPWNVEPARLLELCFETYLALRQTLPDYVLVVFRRHMTEREIERVERATEEFLDGMFFELEW